MTLFINITISFYLQKDRSEKCQIINNFTNLDGSGNAGKCREISNLCKNVRKPQSDISGHDLTLS